MGEELSYDDVRRLLEDPSGAARAVMADKVAVHFRGGGLSDAEREIAEDIIRMMVRDAEVRVREALARTLNDAPDLPGEVAAALARDGRDAVALPVIRNSPVLSDDDLIEIVRTQTLPRQVAVASRRSVSEPVSDAVAEHGHVDAVVALVSNEGAAIAEATYGKIVDRHGGTERLHSPLVRRRSLPVAIAEKILTRVSEELQDYLIAQQGLPEEGARALIRKSRERATVDLAVGEGAAGEVERLVRQLHDNGRLTPSIVLRALCGGDLAFFEAALSVLAGIPVRNATVLVRDEGELGLRALYDRAGLPMPLYAAFRAASDLALETGQDNADVDPDERMRRILKNAAGAGADPDAFLARYDRIDYTQAPT